MNLSDSSNVSKFDFLCRYKMRTCFSRCLFSFEINSLVAYSSVDTQPAFTSSKLTIETLKRGVKYVQVNNKDTRTMPLARTTPEWRHSTVSIVNFEHVISGRAVVELQGSKHCFWKDSLFVERRVICYPKSPCFSV